MLPPRIALLIRNWILSGKGLSTCGHGKEEEDAVEMPRSGVVDEAKAIAISTEAESSSL